VAIYNISSSQGGRCYISADVKAKQQVSSGGLGSGPAPEFCAGPTSPLSRSLSIRARCVFYRREHGLRLLEYLSAPSLNTTRTCWPNIAVSRCINLKSLASDRNNTSPADCVREQTTPTPWYGRTAALSGRLSPACNGRRCCATSLRKNNMRIQHTHQANNALHAVNVLRPSTRLSCYRINILIRARDIR
jgi:hypothetical protein